MKQHLPRHSSLLVSALAGMRVFLSHFSRLNSTTTIPSVLRILMVVFIILTSTISNAASYTWNITTGGAWTTTTNWNPSSPAGGPPTGSDVVINSNQSLTITAVPSISLNSLTVTGTGNCTLQSTASNTLVLGGNVSTDFTVGAGMILTLGATVNITLAVNATAEIDGTLTIGPAETYNTNNNNAVTTVSTTGLVNNSGNLTCTTQGNLWFNGTSTYQHNYNAANSIVPNATWSATSNCNITAAFSNASVLTNFTGQTFGNVTYNCPGQTNTVCMFPGVVHTNDAPTFIEGNFTIISTGSSTLYFRIYGSGIYLIPVYIYGTFSMQGGILDLNNSGEQGNVNVYLYGDFSFTQGTIQATTITNASSTYVYFTKTGTQTFTKAGGVGTFTGSNNTNPTNPINFIVNSGSTLQMGTGAIPSILDGTYCTFTLNSGATLGVTSGDGITYYPGTIGNIQVTNGTSTTARLFLTGANYIYNGSQKQNSGNGIYQLNGATQYIPANLTINNTSGTLTGVTLTQPTTISGVLTLTNGLFTTTTTNLISLTNTATTAIQGGSTTSFINGPVKQTLPVNLPSGSTYNYPVGASPTYLPFSLVNPTTGTGTITAQVQAFNVNSGGTPDGTTLCVISQTEYWSLVPGGNFANSSVSITRQTAIAPLNAVGNSTTSNGTYSSLGGAAGTYGVTNSNSFTGAVARYFVFGEAGNNNPVSVTISASTNPVCAGTSVTFTATPTNGGTAPTYQWYINGTLITGATNSTYTYVPANGDVVKCLVTSNASCVTNNPATSSLTMTVNPLPAVTNSPLTQTICSGASTSLVTLTSGVAGTIFSWTASASSGVSGFTSSGTSTIPVQTITTSGSAQGTVTYAITPTAAGCVGPVTDYYVYVNPLPTVTNSPLTQTICSGASTTLVTLTSGVSGTTFSWTASASGGVSGFTSSGTGTIPVQTISTSGTTQGTVTYAITPTAASCAGTVTDYYVYVNPLPNVSNSPLNQTICSGASTTLVTLTSGVSGTTFAWTASASGGVSGFTSSGTGTIPVQTISISGTTQGTVTYAITPTAAGC
jgi:hypothetical protein